MDSNHIPSCTSAGSVLHLCKVSQKYNKPFRRSCAYKVHGWTDGQGDSYLPSQTLFAGGIIRNCLSQKTRKTYPRSRATYPRLKVTYPILRATYPRLRATYPRLRATYPRHIVTYPSKTENHLSQTESHLPRTELKKVLTRRRCTL